MTVREDWAEVVARSIALLVSRGYQPVCAEQWFLSRYLTVQLAGMKGSFEAIAVQIRFANGSVSVAYVESVYRYELCQVREFLTMAPCEIFVRCELWVVSPNGAIHCFEILPGSVTKVISCAR